VCEGDGRGAMPASHARRTRSAETGGNMQLVGNGTRAASVSLVKAQNGDHLDSP